MSERPAVMTELMSLLDGLLGAERTTAIRDSLRSEAGYGTVVVGRFSAPVNGVVELRFSDSHQGVDIFVHGANVRATGSDLDFWTTVEIATFVAGLYGESATMRAIRGNRGLFYVESLCSSSDLVVRFELPWFLAVRNGVSYQFSLHS